ncbi:hypothetical protein [Sphingomonas sp. M1A8_2b]
MSDLRGIWRTLDLAPTADTAAIRKAYARRLKSFDIDDEPDRYIALRDARDAAIARARSGDDDGDGDDLWDDDGDPVGSFAVAPDLEFADGFDRWSDDDDDDAESAYACFETPSRSAADQDDHSARVAANAHDAAVQEHYAAVVAILFPGDEWRGQVLDRETAAALTDHVGVLLADERLEELKFYTDAERWFAEVVASSSPRSDPILTGVIEHFGWSAGRGRIDQSPAIAAVVERQDALAFASELQSPKHPLHRAWRELRRPATETSRRGWSVRRSKITQLLAKIRMHYPTLERELDWYRVALWDRAPRVAINWRMVWAVFVVALMILRAIYATDNTPRPATPSTVRESAYVSPAKTLDPILAALGGADLTMAKIHDANAKLYDQLKSKWTLARENATEPRMFAKTMLKLLADRYIAGANRAPHALLVDLATLRLDKARAIGARDWKACDDFFEQGTEPLRWTTPDIAARSNELVARVLLETDGDPPAKPLGNTFKVSRAVIDAATERAALSRAEFVKAVRQEGNAKDRCKAMIALGETALSLSATDADPILRHY